MVWLAAIGAHYIAYPLLIIINYREKYGSNKKKNRFSHWITKLCSNEFWIVRGEISDGRWNEYLRARANIVHEIAYLAPLKTWIDLARCGKLESTNRDNVRYCVLISNVFHMTNQCYGMELTVYLFTLFPPVLRSDAERRGDKESADQTLRFGHSWWSVPGMRGRHGACVQGSVHVYEHGRLLHGQPIVSRQSSSIFDHSDVLQLIHRWHDAVPENVEYYVQYAGVHNA